MKFFIDSANLEDIKMAAERGWVDGVTTNPSLLAKEGVLDHKSWAKQLCSLVSGPVSLEVLSLDAKSMVEEGKRLSDYAENVVVKIPLTQEGLKATKQLRQLGIQVNVTLVFSCLQALLAAKCGATYVSPFVGRLDDIGVQGMQLVQDIIAIYTNYNFSTQVLVASVRHSEHVLQAALMGADVVTANLKVLKQLTQHPLTDKGLEQFINDAKKGGITQ